MKLKTLTQASAHAIDLLLMNGHNPSSLSQPATGESPAQLAAAAKVLHMLDVMPDDDGPDDHLAERTVERILQESRDTLKELLLESDSGK